MHKLAALILFSLSLLLTISCKEEIQEKQTQMTTTQDNAKELESLGIETETSTSLKELPVGSTAPLFESKDLNGNTISLKNELAKGPVILVFYRGHWCGYCTKYLSELQSHASDLAEKGVSIIAVSPETKTYNTTTASEHDLTIPILSDSDHSIMKDYGVAFNVNQMYQDKIVKFKEANLTDFSDQEDAVLPIPATFVIAQDQKIQYVHYDPNYRERAPLEEIFKHL